MANITVTGKVVDDIFGEPIKNYQVLMGVTWEDSSQTEYYYGDVTNTNTNGEYSFSFNEVYFMLIM